MRKTVKKLTLSKETLRNLVETELALVPGAYPLSTATNCDACPWGQTISCSLC
jgi:hypothetical protein